MAIDGININTTLQEVEDLLRREEDLTPSLRSVFSIQVVVIKLLVGRVNINSRNSSGLSSADPNRLKFSLKKTGNKPGGQLGHIGTTLQQIPEPDQIR